MAPINPIGSCILHWNQGLPAWAIPPLLMDAFQGKRPSQSFVHAKLLRRGIPFFILINLYRVADQNTDGI
jgi:hypothetical protein